MKYGIEWGWSLYRVAVCFRCDDIGDNRDSKPILLRSEVFQDPVAFFLCSNGTADAETAVKKLGQDVRSDETIASGEKDTMSHLGCRHAERPKKKVECRSQGEKMTSKAQRFVR